MYSAYVTTIKNLRKHPNADRLQLGECFGNTVCVSMEYTDGQIGVYFPTDGQFSVEFADTNNLLRKKDADGNNIGGYMDPDKRNVTSIKLRGEKSDGLFLPLVCLEPFGDISSLTFIHQDTNKKFKFNVDAYGELKSKEIVSNSIESRLSNTSLSRNVRGLIGQLNIQENN